MKGIDNFAMFLEINYFSKFKLLFHINDVIQCASDSTIYKRIKQAIWKWKILNKGDITINQVITSYQMSSHKNKKALSLF